MDAAEREAVARIGEEALAGTFARYGMSRLARGLTSEYDVTWANDVAFLSVVVEPRDAFCLYVGHLVDGKLPPSVGDVPWHYLDVDYFFEHSGVEPPERPPMRPRPEELAESLHAYDEALGDVVGPVLEGDTALLRSVVAGAAARPENDE